MPELAGVGRYRRHGHGRPVVILSNPQADPDWSTTPAAASNAQRSRTFIEHYQDRLDALTGIRVPCLVLGFGQDTDTFVARAREVAAAVPDSRYVELPDAGHLTPVTQPGRVTGPVLQFFADVAASRSDG